MDCFIEWAGYHWMNGQPWGVAHPDPKHVWYADETETKVISDDWGDNVLAMSINNNAKYFGGEVNHTKYFGCGCISTYEEFLYGHFHFEYILPIGIHLWPAIWLSGIDSWPPEIDIVEGWSGDGYFCPNQPNYKKFIGFNRIHPGVFYGTDEHGKAIGKGYGNFGTDNVTYQCYQKLNEKLNTCDLYWHPDNIRVYYNGHKIMDIKEEEILKGLRARMYVCIDLAAADNFTEQDYQKYIEKGTPMLITKFTHEPYDQTT